jgi:Fic family protein
MMKLEIKLIKGHKYLYITDRVKVNAEKLTLTFYVGRLEKTSVESVRKKLAEFELYKLTRYTEYRLKQRRCDFLDPERARKLEWLAYGHQLLRQYYPDEFHRYEAAVFVHYAQSTTALEGNTITLRQAAELFEHDVTPSGKTLREIHELTNYLNLEKFLGQYEGDVSERLIKQMHAILERSIAESLGAYRQIQVYIEKAEYVPPPPFEIPALMRELVAWYRTSKARLHPFELGILLHTKLVTIHPFVNGNGRVGRALLNFVLNRNGYPTLYVDVGQRERYLDAVEKGNNGEYEPIINFLYDLYLTQHGRIMDEIIHKIQREEAEVFPGNEGVLQKYRNETAVNSQKHS